MYSHHWFRTADSAVRHVVVTRIPKPGNQPCLDREAIPAPALSQNHATACPVVGAGSAATTFSADAALVAGAVDPDHEESDLDGARADLNVLSFSSGSSESSSGWVRISPVSSPKQSPRQEERVDTPASEPESPLYPTLDANVVLSNVSSKEVTPSSPALSLLQPVASSPTVVAGASSPILNLAASSSALFAVPALFSSSATASPSSAAAPLQPSFAPPAIVATPSSFSAVSFTPASVSTAVSTPTPAIAQSDSHSAAPANDLDFDAAIRACDDAVPALLQLWPEQDLQPLLASLRSSRDMLSTEACRASSQRAAGVLQEGRLWPSSDTQGLVLLLQRT